MLPLNKAMIKGRRAAAGTAVRLNEQRGGGSVLSDAAPLKATSLGLEAMVGKGHDGRKVVTQLYQLAMS